MVNTITSFDEMTIGLRVASPRSYDRRYRVCAGSIHRFTWLIPEAFYPAMTMDMFWSWFAMPIGLSICFWPFLIAWYLAERKNPDSKQD